MTKLGVVIEAIKEIECPVDKFEEKLEEAYKEYAGDNSRVLIERKSSLDTIGLKAYEVYAEDNNYSPLCVLVREGEEHYVSNVEDAYVIQ